MGFVRLASLVWPGMLLAGVGLGIAVLSAWPEPATRVVRLPYGESQPKTPREAMLVRAPAPKPAPAAPASAVPPVERPDAAPAAPAEAEEAGRVLAAVEPAAETGEGPPPVPSELEGSGGYVQESPEELGAKPLPGAELTPQPPPVAG